MMAGGYVKITCTGCGSTAEFRGRVTFAHDGCDAPLLIELKGGGAGGGPSETDATVSRDGE